MSKFQRKEVPRQSLWKRAKKIFYRKDPLRPRNIDLTGSIAIFHQTSMLTNSLGEPSEGIFAPNKVRNQKYSILSFVPLVLYEQFKYFLNLYFLLVALTQFIPPLQIGTNHII